MMHPPPVSRRHTVSSRIGVVDESEWGQAHYGQTSSYGYVITMFGGHPHRLPGGSGSRGVPIPGRGRPEGKAPRYSACCESYQAFSAAAAAAAVSASDSAHSRTSQAAASSKPQGCHLKAGKPRTNWATTMCRLGGAGGTVGRVPARRTFWPSAHHALRIPMVQFPWPSLCGDEGQAAPDIPQRRARAAGR